MSYSAEDHLNGAMLLHEKLKGIETPVRALGIWLVRPDSLLLGERLKKSLGGDIFKPWEHGGISQRELFQSFFRTRTHWILVMASGIAVRFMNRLLDDKNRDPAVVVVDEGGQHAISLLCGHEGGANALAFETARVLGATAVVSTATEATKSLIAGVGCRKGVSEEQIETCLRLAMGERQMNEIRLITTIDLKADEPGLLSFCERRNLPLQIFAREDVAERAWSSRPSEWVRQNIGVDGVCEPCALMASSRARLIVKKTTCNGVAIAIADDRLRVHL